MKMFINMTKPSPVMAALAEMQGKSFVLSSNQLENVVYQKILVFFSMVKVMQQGKMPCTNKCH